MAFWTTEEVLRLFFSSACWAGPRGYTEEYDALVEHLNRGWITAENRIYPAYQAPQSAEPRWWTYQEVITSGGSQDHGYLKWSAVCWLIDEGETEYALEVSTGRYRADMIGRSLRYWVECGDTNPGKVMDVLTSDRPYAAFCLFPFGGGVWIFRTTPDGVTELRRLQHEQLFKNSLARTVGL